jgi:hypothetical protein
MRELQQLSRLLPRFAPHTHWQQLLLAELKRRADRLSALLEA